MNLNIMVVDDTPSIRKLIKMTLSKAGFKIIEAEDGQDAVEKIVTGHTDLIITDINMPNMDGIELVRQIRHEPRTKYMPVILMTNPSQKELVQEGKKAGATAWIDKPFQPKEMIAVIKKIFPFETLKKKASLP